MGFLRRHLVLSIMIVLIISLIGIGFIPRPVLVDTVTARRGPMQVTIEEEGKTRIMDHYVLSAPVDGFARRIDLDVGDPVTRDQEIGILEPLRPNVLDPRSRAEAEARVSAATAALNAAEREVRAAEADAEYADAERLRLKSLFDTGVIALDRLQQSEADARRTSARLESARFNVQIAEFEKISAEAALKYSAGMANGEDMEAVSLRSPITGRVLKLHHESEGVVSRGQPLIDVGDPQSLEIVVEVLSRDAVQLSPGTRVILTRWGGNEDLEGRVRNIEPVGFTKVSALGVEEQRVYVIVDIVTPREVWARLGDGYRVETTFVLWEADDILQVPSSALFRRGEDWYLYVVIDGRALARQVTPGERSGISTRILDGLTDGDIVINHPGDNLDDGSRVRSRDIP